RFSTSSGVRFFQQLDLEAAHLDKSFAMFVRENDISRRTLFVSGHEPRVRIHASLRPAIKANRIDSDGHICGRWLIRRLKRVEGDDRLEACIEKRRMETVF